MPRLMRFCLHPPQDDNFHLIAGMHHLGWMAQLPGPGHFGNMHKAFHAGFKLDKGAVIDKIGNLALDVRAPSGEAGLDVLPRIWNKLFQAKRNLVVFTVKGEYLQGEVWPIWIISRGWRMRFPARVRNMQKSVKTAQIDKYAIFRDVLGLALHNLAFLQGAQRSWRLASRSSSSSTRRETMTLLLLRLILSTRNSNSWLTRASMSGTGRKSTYEIRAERLPTPPISTV